MKQRHNGQILVVEDDTTLRAALCDTLKAAHFSVLELLLASWSSF